MTRMRKIVLTTGMAALGLSFACSDPPPPPPAPAAAKKAAPAPAAAPSAPAAAAPSPAADAGQAAPQQYVYNPIGKRDPFRNFEENERSQDEGVISCTKPLCQWEIDQFSLVAVVSGDANPVAMVEDPVGTGHIVRRTFEIGKRGGRVTQILRDCIIITEQWTGPTGRVVNPVKLCAKGDNNKSMPVDLFSDGRSN